jgi:hypothetical protein
MKSQSFAVRSLKNQIAATLKLIGMGIKKYILQLLNLEARLEVAMSEQFNFCNVCVSCSDVVVDLDNKSVAYIIQKGYDMGWHYCIKKFNPQGKDIRMLHYASVQGERIDDIKKNSDQQSDEYKAVLKAAYHSEKELVAHGRNCAYPNGFDFGSSRL